MAFYRKYRSKNFHEMVGQEHVTKTLLESVKGDKLVHAYLLTGPRGIGKTSTARLLAKAINCQQIADEKKAGQVKTGEPCNKCESCRDINEGKALDVIEIDAASHTGVDDIRELIEKSRLLPSKLAKKVYIIDEVHMLSKSAFNALLKTLEEPPDHVVFIMATTETHKIPATILSRAQRFDFHRAERDEIIANLRTVAKAEKIEIEDDALDLIAVSAAGAHRDALSLLEQIASSGEKITGHLVRNILGLAQEEEVFQLLGAIFNKNPEEGLKIARGLLEKGRDLVQFNNAVLAKLRQILILQISDAVELDETEEVTARLKELTKTIDQGRALELIEIFLTAGTLFKEVSMPLLPLEIAIVRSTTSSTKYQVPHSSLSERAHPSELKTNTKETSAPPEKKAEPAVEKKTEAEKKVEPEVEEEKPMPTVSIPVLAMTKDIWLQIIEETRKQNATLAALLRDAKPEGLSGNTLTVSVKFKFHKDRISEAKHAKILSEIVSKVVGHECHIVCKIAEAKSKAVTEKTDTEDMDKVVAEVFEIE